MNNENNENNNNHNNSTQNYFEFPISSHTIENSLVQSGGKQFVIDRFYSLSVIGQLSNEERMKFSYKLGELLELDEEYIKSGIYVKERSKHFAEEISNFLLISYFYNLCMTYMV